MEQIIKIAYFIANSFVHLWPYLLITIPLAVAVQLSGAAKFINKAFSNKPLIAILLATIVGAFSPFCSCGVIPIITTLLISGVPLAPVMAFWIASPSMDPEIFFLSTAAIGWELSVWRLVSTFVISLSAGYITHFAVRKGFIGKDILRGTIGESSQSPWKFLGSKVFIYSRNVFHAMSPGKKGIVQLVNSDKSGQLFNPSCCIAVDELELLTKGPVQKTKTSCSFEKPVKEKPVPFGKKLMKETWKATTMVAKFMGLAFLINALITFYVPQDFITQLLGGDGSLSVLIATLVGIPAYTSNITALPLISGLIILGMNKGAALAFLIAGPTTTLPAMVAVWGITKRRIFILYISFSLLGAVISGLLFNIIN